MGCDIGPMRSCAHDLRAYDLGHFEVWTGGQEDGDSGHEATNTAQEAERPARKAEEDDGRTSRLGVPPLLGGRQGLLGGRERSRLLLRHDAAGKSKDGSGPHPFARPMVRRRIEHFFSSLLVLV